MTEPKIWMNGKLSPQAEAVLPVNSAAVFYATNVFEGLRAYWNEDDERALLLPARRALRPLPRVDEDDALHGAYSDETCTTPSARCSRATSLREDIHMHMVAYVARHRPRRHGPDRPLHQPAPPRARRRGHGHEVLHQLLGAHLRQRDPDPPEVRLELPERPPRHAAGEGRRLRRADLPEQAGPRRRGHRRHVLHGAQGPARHAAA